MKKCSVSLIIRQMQIKTTVRYQLTPVRIAVIKRQQITSVGKETEQKETFVHCWQGYKLV